MTKQGVYRRLVEREDGSLTIEGTGKLERVPAEARKLAREAKGKVGEAMARLDAGDHAGAYEAAEAAQHAAYELKSLINAVEAGS